MTKWPITSHSHVNHILITHDHAFITCQWCIYHTSSIRRLSHSITFQSRTITCASHTDRSRSCVNHPPITHRSRPSHARSRVHYAPITHISCTSTCQSHTNHVWSHASHVHIITCISRTHYKLVYYVERNLRKVYK